MIVQGNIVDILNGTIFKGELVVEKDKITAIRKANHSIDNYILPGFVDAHIHIESAMLVPSEFARIAVTHGTIATVSDPHEIANVLGVKGVEFMIENGKKVPLKFNFGAPSCVPATSFESAGAVINADDIKKMLENPDIKYLAEMMNYPGVLYDDKEVLAKIEHAKNNGKPIDGHAPGLRGEDASKYIAAGITTDHECFSYDEALEKLQKGMKVIIREGSAAKNFEELIDLLPNHYKNMMFCSDDKHPDDLLLGHINELCKRAVAKGIDVFKVLQAACVNPVKHYNLDVGLLQKGDFADFIIVDDLAHFNVIETYINGEVVAKNGESFIETNQIETESLIDNGNLVSNTATDVLKMTVVNRYQNNTPTIAFIKNFGLKEGAIASSVGHDSHNIIAVGVSDEAICKAVNLIIENRGGVCAVSSTTEKIVSLPVAGIMSDKSAKEIGKAYAALDAMAKEMGSKLKAPYMSLSFMALLVIPSLKLSDKGLFDGNSFKFTSLEIE